MSETKTTRPLTGWHVLFCLLGFFLVVSSVNAVFAYIAIDGFSGIHTEDAYVKGLSYNEELDAAEAQRALGWKVKLDTPFSDDGQLLIESSFADKDSLPLKNLQVTAELRRPAVEGHDEAVDLHHLGEGRYTADLNVALRGQWDLILVAENDRGESYRLEQRLWLN